MSMSLNFENIVDSRENTYFVVVLLISLCAWALCIVTIFPIFIALAVSLFVWFANGLLIAQLKAEAVKIHEGQLPELAQTLRGVCEKLQVREIPDLYILQSQGMLNAFATRFCGRNFVVVYSELLETYGPQSAEIEFLLGHEIGHIKQNHILKHILLAPGMLFPLIGNAYNRACESTCDRHGAYAASSIQGAVNAMMILAGGKKAVELMTPAHFAQQNALHRGFFVSWYELISGYPTMSRRVASLIAMNEGHELPRPRRNPFAYFFAFFTLGGRTTGGGNVMITVAVIGLLTAIAIPNFLKAREQALKQKQAQAIHQMDKRQTLQSTDDDATTK